MSDFKDVILKKLPKGIELNENNPEIVISFGGDGTFLISEAKYPGIPKLFVKHKWDCTNCSKHDFIKMFKSLSSKNYSIVEFDKLEAFVNGKKEFVALNDVNLHYVPPRAVRFSLDVNGKLIGNEIICDGLIVATRFGSTGYFHSVAKESFNKGYGLVINNPTCNIDAITSNTLKVEAKILRGPAVLAADCLDKTIQLKDRDTVLIRPSSEKAKIIQIGQELRYTDY